jgi:hypothetical protein
MDDWALTTVSDFDDRTRVRAVAGAVAPKSGRRRRRAPAVVGYAGVGTVLKQSNRQAGSVPGSGSARQNSQRGSSAAEPATPGRRVRALVWGLIAAAVVVVGLGAAAAFVLVQANSTDIPKIADISARSNADSVQFAWTDPGVKAGDQYQVATKDGQSSIQTTRSYSVDATKGQRVCITVTVNREGKMGPASTEKCVDFSG